MTEKKFLDAVLVVLGHGTAQNENSAAPVFQHAAELRRRNVFASVREAFWKQDPRIKTVLAGISAPRIFIVPLFISEGYFSAEIIPRELGFTSVPATIQPASFRWFYCKPIGTHDSMTDVLLSRARSVMETFPFPRPPKSKETTLIVAGHGTEKNENSRVAIQRQVELTRAKNEFAEVHAVFLDEEPRIAKCFELTQTRNMVVVPFFISDGLHVQADIPVLLGEPQRMVKERLAASQPTWRNPTERNGKMIWYSSSVGSDPHIADVILERVGEAAKL